jgi:uncharacterized membrane protein HdeD (DUF308 family)
MSILKEKMNSNKDSKSGLTYAKFCVLIGLILLLIGIIVVFLQKTFGLIPGSIILFCISLIVVWILKNAKSSIRCPVGIIIIISGIMLIAAEFEEGEEVPWPIWLLRIAVEIAGWYLALRPDPPTENNY